MNPGAVEEAGKVAGTFMGVMKEQPLALALCVMNIMLMALFFYIAQHASENRRREFDALQESQKEVNKLLYNCTPLRSGEFKLQSDESRPIQLPPLPQTRPEEAPK
jgi:hypothetical protein